MFTFAVDLQAATEFFRQYILPYLQTAMYTLVPILTPYITNKVSTKFSDIKTLIATSIADINEKFSTRIAAVEKQVIEIKAIPEQVKAVVSPIYKKLDQIEDTLVLISANSRIPDGVKRDIVGIRDNAVKAEDYIATLVKEKEEALAKAQKEIDDLKASIATKAVEVVETIKDKASKKQSKKKNLW